MREVADKISADGFEPAQAGQVLGEQEASAGMLVGDDNQLQILVPRGNYHRFALNMARLLAAPPCFYQLMIAHDLGDRVIKGIAKLEQPTCGGVGKLDYSLGIGDEHTVCDLFEDGGELGMFCIEFGIPDVEVRHHRDQGAGKTLKLLAVCI